MERLSVTSSNVESIGYDESSETLEIEFKNGSIYQYFEVNAKVFEELRAADSVGAYMSAHIKGKYRYSRT